MSARQLGLRFIYCKAVDGSCEAVASKAKTISVFLLKDAVFAEPQGVAK